MAGINNFNLGNNLKLQQTQQLKSTAKVDTKVPEKEVGDAKPAAVWVVNYNHNGPIFSEGYDAQLGDVAIVINGDSVEYQRLTINVRGEEEWITIRDNDIQKEDYEKDRGDLRSWY